MVMQTTLTFKPTGRTKLAALTTALLFASILFARAQTKSTAVTVPENVTKVASVEGITEYNLKNGLRVLLFPDPSKPTVTVNMVYLVGSRHEGLGETGMAHLLEHMAFKGTPRYPKGDRVMAERGARTNGTTSYDRTNYYETLPATDDNLKFALGFEADRMVNQFISQNDLVTEFSVVRNEFEIGENSPQYILMERVISSAYLWHNYGKSVIGSKEDIERVPIKNLKAFYQTYYQPDNAVLVVAGRFDETKAISWVREFLGAIPRPTRLLPKPYSVEPTQDGERMTTLRRVGDTQGIGVAYHVPAGSHPDYAPLDVLSEMLTNEPSGRLYKALVENKKAALQWNWTPTLHDPGFAYYYTELRKDQSLDSAKTAMLTTLDDVSRQTPTVEEVSRAKTKLLKDVDLLFKNPDRFGLRLSDWIAAGDWRLIFLYRDAIRNVQPTDVQRVGQAYFKPANRTVGVFIPDQNPNRAEIPETPDIAARVNAYRGDAGVVAGEAFDVSPANIDARTKRGTEAGGLTWAMLKKRTRGNSVNVQIRLNYGDELSLMNRGIAGRLTALMLDRGTKSRSYQASKDELDKLNARVTKSAGGQAINITLETEQQNLPAALSIVLDFLRNPTFPQTEFDKLKQEQLAELEAMRQEPQEIAFRLSRRLLAPYSKGHPLAQMTFEEEIAALQALTLDDVKAFYRDFYGASQSQVALVGSFDEPAVRQQLRAELGNWRSPKTYARLPLRLFPDAKPQTQAVQTSDKASAVFAGGLRLSLRDDSPDYPAFWVATHVLGNGFNSRLVQRIREKEGISYGVSSWAFANDTDPVGGLNAYAIFNPENADKFDTAFREEINKIVNDGITADELKLAQQDILQSRQLERAQDTRLASTWVEYLSLPKPRTFSYDAEFENKITALTPDQINATLKKYLDYNKLTMIRAGDFAKAAKKAAEKKPASAVGGGAKN